MSATLVVSYGIDSADGKTFTLSFSIPDNCEYTLTIKDGVYWIFITLKPGQTKPSANYIPYTIKLDAIDSVVSVQFEQQGYEDGNTTTLRPKIRVDE